MMMVEVLIVIAVVGILLVSTLSVHRKASQACTLAGVREDLRTTAVGLSSYGIDNGAYPFSFPGRRDGYGNERRADLLALPIQLTTPIAYLAGAPVDCYKVGQNITGSAPNRGRPYESGDAFDVSFLYVNIEFEQQQAFSSVFPSRPAADAARALHGRFWLASIGPVQNYAASLPGGTNPYASINGVYDPTNGTLSPGLVIHDEFSSLDPPPPPVTEGLVTY
jgi:type II secretory pathway pseudopilin PulG